MTIVCVKNDGFCIRNDGFCIKMIILGRAGGTVNDETMVFTHKMMHFVLKMMHLAFKMMHLSGAARRRHAH